MSANRVRFTVQNWSRPSLVDERTLSAARSLVAELQDGRIVSVGPGSMLIEAAAPRDRDAERVRHRLEQALPGWSVYPETTYRLP